jgi:hypothetical protein
VRADGRIDLLAACRWIVDSNQNGGPALAHAREWVDLLTRERERAGRARVSDYSSNRRALRRGNLRCARAAPLACPMTRFARWPVCRGGARSDWRTGRKALATATGPPLIGLRGLPDGIPPKEDNQGDPSGHHQGA